MSYVYQHEKLAGANRDRPDKTGALSERGARFLGSRALGCGNCAAMRGGGQEEGGDGCVETIVVRNSKFETLNTENMNTKERIIGVYLIERINKSEPEKPHYYVGLSDNTDGIFERLRQHCCNNQQYIDKAIQKYGITNFSFRILERVSSSKQLKECETKWINFYKEKYGANQLYNISETSNTNPTIISKEVRKKITSLFEDDLGRSIYAITEKFNIDWEEVREIRKKLLDKKGLKYDKNNKQIYDKKTKQIVEIPDNWRGHRVTKTLSEKIISKKRCNIDDKDIAKECNMNTTDLRIFLNEYDEKNPQQYQFADTI
jgi:group I intron endonuclease